MSKLSIYIHIPFCIRKCLYCDFLSFPADEIKRERYVDALLKEIDTESEKYKQFTADTIFFGGGTPSLLDGTQINSIMDKLRVSFSLAENAEITMEVNPGTASGKQLEAYRKAGINRLSIGTQSVCNEELELLGRIHTAEEFFDIYSKARAAGFSNINVDIMSALPGQTVERYKNTLTEVLKLEPEHISAYSLIIEEDTPFYKFYGTAADQHMPKLPSEEEDRIMYEYTEKFLLQNGYHRYEISNYSRPGKECRHNMAYWKRYAYAGFGIGASSMVDNVRWKNISDIDEYIDRMENTNINASCSRQKLLKSNIREQIHELSVEEQMEEFMFLGLRLTQGIKKEEFYQTFGKKIDDIYGKAIDKLCRQKLIEEGTSISLTPYGRDISNYVLSEFLH